MTEATLSSLLDLRHKFLGFVQRRVNDPATAEDILQTAYVRSLGSAGQLRDNDSAVAWFLPHPPQRHHRPLPSPSH